MMQLHAIFDHVLKHKWWVDRELHFHVPIFLKNCTCRTGINMSRKWLDQAPKNIDLYLCFFRFPGLWLVTVPLIFSLAHGGSCELPPKSIFFIPRHVDLFCRKKYCLRAAFSWAVWQHMATQTQKYNYRDLGQPWFYQPIFNKSWAEKKHHLRWRWITGQFLFFFGDRIDSIWCFLVIPGEYGLPALARVTQIIF